MAGDAGMCFLATEPALNSKPRSVCPRSPGPAPIRPMRPSYLDGGSRFQCREPNTMCAALEIATDRVTITATWHLVSGPAHPQSGR